MISSYATANANQGVTYYDFYMNLPEVFKAGIIAIARDGIGVEEEDVNVSEWHSRIGEGGVNYDTLPTLVYIRDGDFVLRNDGQVCFETNDINSRP